MKTDLRNIITEVVNKQFSGIKEEELAFTVSPSDNPEHGDYATNVAMQLAKTLKKNPKTIAESLAETIIHEDIKHIEIAGPGFMNFFINDSAFHRWLSELLKSDSSLKSEIGKGKKIMVEFVSANPTGPLHVGHGRGAALGDSIAAILEACGYSVYREYYVNDAGNQMNNLAASILSRYFELYGKKYPFPGDGYYGEYITKIAEELRKTHKDELLRIEEGDAVKICKKEGIKLILADIDKTLKRFRVNLDNYFQETSIYTGGELEETLNDLNKRNAVYSHDGALWLSTKRMGDDEDRVLQKSDGSYTYLAPDIAYHRNKYRRGFDLLVDVWGADHHGYVKRMECALNMLGCEGSFDVALVQMVSLKKGGERLVMSTRAGQFVTLDWLLDETGVDAARFFYNMRGANSQFEFDIDLAKTQSTDNPVYYVQYAYARVCSILATAAQRGLKAVQGENIELLTLPAEKKIIKKMMDFRYVLETAAAYNEPHSVAYFLQELAGEFHGYYYNTVILNDKDLQRTNARLNLCMGVAKNIKFGLGLLGVSAPEKM
ncbi:MAG: arginine--tRNA ligase [Deferribacteraceae bacterium]|jgi:arginyl-tRNA synthetase|nr:arginine--tRNA ligase [Deferribacteraceae bacterium]